MGKTMQKQVIKEMVQNGGNIERAVREAKDPKTGKQIYSEKYARSGKIVKTKSWPELLDKYIPDEDLVKVTKEGLNATFAKPIIVGRDEKGKPEYEYVEKPDFGVRHRYLETGLKVKGKIIDILPQTINQQVNLNFFSNPAVMEAAKNLDQAVKKYIYDNAIKKSAEVL